MDQFNLYPLILKFGERIEDILNDYWMCLFCVNDEDLPLSFRMEKQRWLKLHREALILEVELVKTILLEKIDQEEEICPE